MLYGMLKNSLQAYGSQKIILKEKTVTYQWILKESERIGGKLTAQKYGIYCSDKLNCILAIFACLQKRKTIVLLCPEYGTSFNQNIAKKAELKNYITDAHNKKLEIYTECFEEEAELEDVAFIIHTSGSTGSSKGVLLTQENIYENIKSTLGYYAIQEKSTALLYRPIYHTTTVFGELFTTIAAGAKLYIEPSSMPLPYLARIIRKYGITNLAGTPTFFTELLKAAHSRAYYEELKVISVGGECMTKSAVITIKNGFPGAEIFHCYGMTEASPRVLYLPSDYFGEQYQCVGRPLDGVEVKLENELKESVPSRMGKEEHHIGELFVRGANIMKGYYRDETATKKVLKNGWYATGDYGYRDEKGFYYIVGRKDQLSIRAGVNVWPRDIEEAISQHPLVQEVYVYMEQHEKSLLVAQVVGEGLSQQELMKWCVQKLPMPYVPDKIEIEKTVVMRGCGKRSLPYPPQS